MPSSYRKIGDLGEDIAIRFLIKKQFQILERNYQKKWGEIDIVAQKGNSIIFFEVKTRDSKNISIYPAELSVNKSKQAKLRKICQIYLLEKKFPLEQEWQIDILAIALDRTTRKARIKHIPNAVFA